MLLLYLAIQRRGPDRDARFPAVDASPVVLTRRRRGEQRRGPQKAGWTWSSDRHQFI